MNNAPIFNPKEIKSDYWQVTDDGKLKTSEIIAEMRKDFNVYVYDEANVDKEFPAPSKPTTRYFKKNIEADPELANKSANELKQEEQITLRERLLLELQYFKETGGHLDIDNITLCAGSRDSGGYVPNVYWHADHRELCVRWCHPAGRLGQPPFACPAVFLVT